MHRIQASAIVIAFFLLLTAVIATSRKTHSRKTLTAQTTTTILPDNCRQIDNGALPDKRCTPGAINRHVTQSDIARTICKRGWSSSVRPPVSYTEPLKRKMVRRYGYGDASLTLFQFDHLIPLELGGNPTSIKNLWPEPYKVVVNGKNAGATVKDYWENKLHAEVCRHEITLSTARKYFRTGGWLGH